MKTFLTVLLLTFLSTSYAADDMHNHDNHEHTDSKQGLSTGNIDPGGETINANVFGLVCDFCAQAIEKVFMKRDEVSGINVDLAGGLVTIYTKKDETIDDTDIEKLIVDAGYNVESINRKESN